MVKTYEGRLEERDGIIFSDLLKRERAKIGFDKSTKELIEIAKRVNVLVDESPDTRNYKPKNYKK